MARPADVSVDTVKRAVDLINLASEFGLSLHRAGSKFKALCPFHDDHHPSLILDPDRQSYKCWACGAGGDVIAFVQAYERVDFPEALRMVAERAGIALKSANDRRDGPEAEAGPSKSDLLAACDWAAGEFAAALADSTEARSYVGRRGIGPETAERFGLGYAPDGRDWLLRRARSAGKSPFLLETAGLVGRREGEPRPTYDRFRGRLIFPIRDTLGRSIGFGGRILPAAEESAANAGRRVAKYLNSPETPVFQKRRQLYAADLARAASRSAGWVAVVEGYTDVIAAHQAGVSNVVGTLGTALGDEHVGLLRRLADRVVLVFDGDEAGQKAADRSLELFLGHEVDLRVLSLPDGLDPADYLERTGADGFSRLVETAPDPLNWAIDRASRRFDIEGIEGARLAAEWVVGVIAKVPAPNRVGLDVKLAKALDTLAHRLRVDVKDLRQRLKAARVAANRVGSKAVEIHGVSPDRTQIADPIDLATLDPTDRELIDLIWTDPSVVSRVVRRIPLKLLRPGPLRDILEACYEVAAVGRPASFEEVVGRLDGATGSMAAGLSARGSTDRDPLKARPPDFESRLAGVLAALAERDHRERLRDLEAAKLETDSAASPHEYAALRREYFRMRGGARYSAPQRPADPRSGA